MRADWKPVLGINTVILGLIFLFIEPNPNDPLNKEASELMRIAKDTHPNHLVADRFYDACRLRHGFVSLACTARQMLLLGLAEYDKEVGTPWGEIVKPFDDTPPLRKSNHPLANWDK